MNKKRDELLRTQIDEAYMLCALGIASNSGDPSTQVGACYVSEDGYLLSVGCNHVPLNWDEDKYPWEDKNTYMIHAEMAAMANYQGSIKDFKNGTIYVTLFPCVNCAKIISSLGVKKIIYKDVRDNCEEFNNACTLLDNSGIEYIKFDKLSNVDSLEYDMNQNEKNTIKIKKKSLTIH